MISPAFLLNFLLTTNVELLWNYWLISAWYLKTPSHSVVGNIWTFFFFFHLGYHFTFIYMAFNLLLYCLVTQSCKLFLEFLRSVSVLASPTTPWQETYLSNFHSLSQAFMNVEPALECWSNTGLCKSPVAMSLVCRNWTIIPTL